MGRVGKVSFLDGKPINDKRKLEESTLESFGLDIFDNPTLVQVEQVRLCQK